MMQDVHLSRSVEDAFALENAYRRGVREERARQALKRVQEVKR